MPSYNRLEEEKVRVNLYITKENRDWAEKNIRNLSVFLDKQIGAARRMRQEENVKSIVASALKDRADELQEEGSGDLANILRDNVTEVLQRIEV